VRATRLGQVVVAFDQNVSFLGTLRIRKLYRYARAKVRLGKIVRRTRAIIPSSQIVIARCTKMKRIEIQHSNAFKKKYRLKRFS